MVHSHDTSQGEGQVGSEQSLGGEGGNQGTPEAQEGRWGGAGDEETGTLLQCCHLTGSTVPSSVDG